MVRGSKPTAKLRSTGLVPGITAGTPSTEGVIETLRHEALRGRRVGVQLYPGHPNAPLIDFFREAGAEPDPLVPYRYASRQADEVVLRVIRAMAAGEVDLMAVTSSPQLRWRHGSGAAGRELPPQANGERDPGALRQGCRSDWERRAWRSPAGGTAGPGRLVAPFRDSIRGQGLRRGDR